MGFESPFAHEEFSPLTSPRRKGRSLFRLLGNAALIARFPRSRPRWRARSRLLLSQNAHGSPDILLTGPALRRIVRYSVLPYVRELFVERGRDVGPALKTVEGFFEKYYGAVDDPAEP